MQYQQTQCPNCQNSRIGSRKLVGRTNPLTNVFYTMEQYKALQLPGIKRARWSALVVLCVVGLGTYVISRDPAVSIIGALVSSLVVGILVVSIYSLSKLGRASLMNWKKTAVTAYHCPQCDHHWTYPTYVTLAMDSQ